MFTKNMTNITTDERKYFMKILQLKIFQGVLVAS